jgi:3-methyladenine DNA glycosylase AlkD
MPLMINDSSRKLSDEISYGRAIEVIAASFIYWVDEEDLPIIEAKKALEDDIHVAISKQINWMRREITKEFDERWSEYLENI